MSKQSIALLTLTIAASGAVVANRFVTPANAQAADGENTLGVATTAAANGDALAVEVLGTSIVETGAAVAAGATLKSDAAGRVIPWATSGAKVAVALQAATAAGEFIEVLLIQNAA